MESRPDAQTGKTDRRASPRTLVDRYYSVQFSIAKETPAYQFKLRDLSKGGLSIAVRRDSAILEHLKTGEIHRMRYAPLDAPGQLKDILTEIRHITLCQEGPYKDHYLVGLCVVEEKKSA